MENNNINFFEQLAGVKQENEQLEADLVRASKASAVEINEAPIRHRTAVTADEDFEEAEGHLTIDVYQNEHNIVIESTIAGVDVSDIDVSITSESVVIKGKREKKERVKKEDYLYQECFWGKFSRSIILPQEIDPDKAQASLKDGLLKIVLPKIHKSESKKIRVKLD